MTSFGRRVIGAALLNVSVYEEVEADTSATVQAMGVVLLSSVAGGVLTLQDSGFRGLLGMTIGSLAAWFVWAALIFVIGTKVLPEPQTESNVGELLRTIGFAASPGILIVLGLIPLLGGMVGIVVWLWMIVATVVAVRQALDYRSTLRAVAVCVIGFAAYWLVRQLSTNVFG